MGGGGWLSGDGEAGVLKDGEGGIEVASALSDDALEVLDEELQDFWCARDPC